VTSAPFVVSEVGEWAVEFVEPRTALEGEGVDVTVATPGGGEAGVDAPGD
jgi:putative intracellular protease/amidase